MLLCVNKSCRVLYGNNFFRVGNGVRGNTARSRDELGNVLHVTTRTGVCAKYLAAHYARFPAIRGPIVGTCESVEDAACVA